MRAGLGIVWVKDLFSGVLVAKDHIMPVGTLIESGSFLRWGTPM